MNVEQRKQQIAEKQKELSDATAELEGFRLERAKLTTGDKPNDKAVKKLDGQIQVANEIIENAPTELQFLNEHLIAEEQQVAQAAMDALLSQQKSAAKQLEDISPKLVAALEVAHNLNIQLADAERQYCGLLSQTGQQISMNNHCRPSEQLLKVVYDVLKAELEGGSRINRPKGQPPFVKV